MCTVMTALTALSAGASLYQGYASGQYAQAQADAQADALEQNAQISREQGHDAVQRGGLEELKLRRQLANLRGNQRVQAASSGIDINSGSALDVQNSSIAEGEFDAETIRYNAARAKWGYDTQADNMTAQADNMTAQAHNTRALGAHAKSNALIGGVANALGTAGNFYALQQGDSPLTEADDRTKYWGPVYNPGQYKKRGYDSLWR